MDERGNCCYWTSKGFLEADLLLTHSNFPLVSWYKFLIMIVFNRTNYFKNTVYKNYHITLYKSETHDEYPKGSLLYPFYWLKHGYSKFWKTEEIANSTVQLVDSDSENAKERTIKITNVVDQTKSKWIKEHTKNIQRKLFLI
jgi:hypothetical protein